MVNKFIDTNFKIDDLIFHKNITRLSNGAKLLSLGNKNKKLILETPYLIVPFGINSNKYDNDKFTLDVSFDFLEDKTQKKFYKNLLKIDKRIMEEVISRSKSLFTDELSEDVIKNNYSRQIKKSKGDYPPRIRIKLPYEQNKFNFEIIDEDNNNIENLQDYLTKGSKVKCVIESGGVWIINNNYSFVWKMKKMEVIQKKKPESDFIEDSDSE